MLTAGLLSVAEASIGEVRLPAPHPIASTHTTSP